MSTKLKVNYHFHPLELAFVGFSGTGKTTLISSLLANLKASQWQIAFVKHDAHGFQMDREGKDTFRAKNAGADPVYISSGGRSALLADKAHSMFLTKSLFLDADALILEGYKSLDIDKIVLLNDEKTILNEVETSRILAYVGETISRPFYLPEDAVYFQRDEVEAIASVIHKHWLQKLRERPLKALVLAGGRSERMGEDKGRMNYHGKAQAIWLCDLMGQLDLQPFLSLREGQWTAEETRDIELITDRFLGFGPLGGILSAMQSDPHAAWLVVACDLPLLNRAVLRNLLEKRSPQKMATAYRSSTDALPEPLCAIYEPKMRTRLLEALSLGYSCPRKALLNSESQILEPFNLHALDNANTAADAIRIRHLLKETPV